MKTFESCCFYRLLAEKKGARFWIRAFSVLAIPYLLIAGTYLIIRWKTLSAVPIDLWFEIVIASSWFFFGPILVYKFIKSFIGLKDQPKFTSELRNWFQDKAGEHYKIYRYSMRIFGPIFMGLVVIILLCRPDILTGIMHITSGYKDVFYWMVLVFLLWFLYYCSNAMALITLMIAIVYSIKKNNIIFYDPLDTSHHGCVKELLHFCNKTVSNICSGLVFLPMAIFFLWQQVYTGWVFALLVFYSIFLFAAITYPRSAIKSYIDERSKNYLLEKKVQYLRNSKRNNPAAHGRKNKIAHQLRVFNSYLYIQELETICSPKVTIDSNTVITYITIIATLATAISGFIKP